jgi:hypothetical protein
MMKLRNLTFVITLMAPALALAATSALSAAVRAACGADARKLCGPVIRDPDARHKCMVEHRAQLSEACKAAIAQGHLAPPEAPAAPAVAAPSVDHTPGSK